MFKKTDEILGKASRQSFMTAMEWIANAMLWSGGALMAISPKLASESWEIFLALLIGQSIWGWAAFCMKKWSLLASCVFFCLLNVYGVIVRL